MRASRMRASRWLGGLLGALALGAAVPAQATSVAVGYGGRDCDPHGRVRSGYRVYPAPGYGYGYDAWGRPGRYVIVPRGPVYGGDVVPFGYGYVQPGFVIGGGVQFGAPPFAPRVYGFERPGASFGHHR